MGKIILEQIIKTAKRYPNKLAIADSLTSSVTYKELLNRICGCAVYLRQQGISKGDCVMLCGISRIEYVISYFAIHLLGAIAVPYEKYIDSNKLTYMIHNVEAKLNLTDGNQEGIISSLDIFEVCSYSDYNIPEVIVTADDVADILFTSGTTGMPKGVVMTHKNIFCGAENVAVGVELSVEDVDMIVAPMNHAYAMGCLRAAMIQGAAVVLHDNCTKLKEMMEKLVKYQCTGYSCPVSVLNLLYQYTKGALDKVFGNIRYLELGTESLSPEMKQELLQLLPDVNIYLNYGATEAPRTVYMDLHKYPDKLASIGKPAINAKICIMDDENNQMPLGSDYVGRLVIEGEMVMPGYFKNEEESVTVVDRKRFFTNDIGYMDRDGFIYLLGRKNDIIKVAGELISPIEIENVANQCDYVELSACVSVKDLSDVLGEKIVLFVQSKKRGKDFEDYILNYLAQRLPPIKVPKHVVLIDEIPVTYVGKLDRKRLLQMI